MGIEGSVVLKVGINAKGEVVQVRVIGKAGHGFDEAARDALRQFKFSPARTSDGQAVDVQLHLYVRVRHVALTPRRRTRAGWRCQEASTCVGDPPASSGLTRSRRGVL